MHHGCTVSQQLPLPVPRPVSNTIYCMAAKHLQSSDGVSRCIVIAAMMQCRKKLHTQAVLVCMSHATVPCGIIRGI